MSTVTVMPDASDVVEAATKTPMPKGKIAAITAGVLVLAAGAEWLRRSFLKKRAAQAEAASDDAAAAAVMDRIEERFKKIDEQIAAISAEVDNLEVPIEQVRKDIRVIAEALGTNPAGAKAA